jgi:RecA/RadA recombinase
MSKTKNVLIEKLRAASKIGLTSTLEESTLFDNDVVSTHVPMIDVALSGRIDNGGITSGSTVLAGPSKHFKSSFGLLMVAAYLQKYKDSVCLFYDNEFGSPKSYFQSFGIDPARIVHSPITNIEELKFDLVSQLEGLTRGDKVIIMIDSVGNVASKKEVEDAINSKAVADMTRAKALKGLFRMVTPILKVKDIPMISIAHTYETQEMYSKTVVSGGTGIYYGADNIWILGRQQDKDKDAGVLNGYHFVINVDKSRFVKEKSKVLITVGFDKGIQRYSGLLEVALEGGYVIKPKNGWYVAFDPATKKELSKSMREDQTYDKAFWDNIFDNTDFKKYVEKTFSLGNTEMLAPTKEA